MGEEEVIRKQFIRINGRELLTEVRILWPTPETLQEALIDQLKNSLVEELVISFRVDPVLDEGGREVDRIATGDAKVRIRALAWGAMDIKSKEGP